MNNEIICKYEPLWGEWKVDKLIGEGSIGKVYKLSKDLYGKKYYSAVKLITIPTKDQYENYINFIGNEDSIDDYFKKIVKSVTNEIELLYSLKGHSNIISYEDNMIKKENGTWYIFIRMEYAKDLKTYIKDNKLDNKEKIKIAIDICNALIMCHEKDIIHRDIKEANIFVSNTTGMFKLGDFSISKEVSNKTSANTRVGTMNYMPPEIVKGENYTKNVDIYCLGIVLYKLFNNGRLPFVPVDTKNINLEDIEGAYIKRINSEYLEKPCGANDDISNIILKACAKNTKNRYQSATDLKNDLEIYHKSLLNNDFSDDLTENILSSTKKIDDDSSTIDIFSLKNVNDTQKSDNKNRKLNFKIIVPSMAIFILIIICSTLFIKGNSYFEDKVVGEKNKKSNESKVLKNDKSNYVTPTNKVSDTNNKDINIDDNLEVKEVKENEKDTKKPNNDMEEKLITLNKEEYNIFADDYEEEQTLDFIWFGNSNKNFTSKSFDIKGDYSLVQGDFNGDLFWDILWYGSGDNRDSIWYGKSGREFNVKSINVSGIYKPISGDFNGDGTGDIFWYGSGDDKDTFWSFKKGNAYDVIKQNVTGFYMPVSGDFNGDGIFDIIWYGEGINHDSLWYGKSDSKFKAADISINGKYKPISGDFNGDGNWDVFWYNPGEAQDYIWYGSKNSNFIKKEINVVGTYKPASGDFNGDKCWDILWYGYGSNKDDLWYGNTNNSFTPNEMEIKGKYDLLTGDYDKNGCFDILLYNKAN
ncbi:MAG: protein kinase [Clostridiales bacterium]